MQYLANVALYSAHEQIFLPGEIEICFSFGFSISSTIVDGPSALAFKAFIFGIPANRAYMYECSKQTEGLRLIFITHLSLRSNITSHIPNDFVLCLCGMNAVFVV